MFDATRALETIRRLDFPRFCGSEGEARAMRLLADEVTALGLQPRYHDFRDWWVEPADACLLVKGETIAVEPAVPLPLITAFEWMGGAGIEVQIRGKLARPDQCEPAPGRDSIAVLDSFDPSAPTVPRASAQLLLFAHTPEFIPYALATETFVPSAYVQPQEASAVLAALGQRAALRWKARRVQRTFRNLTAQIPGRTLPHEQVIIGAHLDSFPGTVGASDDAAGCAILLEAARWFSAHPPDRTVRLLWFTGEELDRRGSRHFVADHNLEPTAAILFINVDSGFERGAGPPYIRVCPEPLAAWAKQALDVEGLEMHLGPTGSADVTAFQERAIPTFWVCGPSLQPAHLPTDRPETIDPERLYLIGSLSIQAATLAAQASAQF